MPYFDLSDISIETMKEREYDLCIFATGYEKRARYLLSKTYKNILNNIPIKLCFSFDDYKEFFDRDLNDKLFSVNGFKLLNVDKLVYGCISKELRNELSNGQLEKETLRVLVDYTVMRRGWYSEILQYFNMISRNGKNVLVTFVYTCGSYSGKKRLKVVDDYSLIPGFEGIGSQRKEKYGIYSLGFEPISVQSLNDWVEPSGVSCFVADPGATDGSGDKCLRLNKTFIEECVNEVIRTPILHMRNYCDLVLDIIKEKSPMYDIVLFGGGPKPFVLGNFLCSLLRPKVSNIYLRGPESEPINVESAGSFVITDVFFSSSIQPLQ